MEERVHQPNHRLEQQKPRKRHPAIIWFLACLVVFCTTYALILPALTLERTAYCGHTAHTHSDSCYTRQLVCGMEESEGTAGHTHTDACYQTERVLICSQEDGEEHTHTDACYEEQKTLICGQEERAAVEGHTHTDACYQRVLTCGMEEHTHALACYSNPKADLENKNQWEDTLPEEFSGIWANDLLAVAETQLGYTESGKNYQVSDNNTKGYTRYGAWYGSPYGDWCAMFISFCLHYAGIPEEAMPYEAGCSNWVDKLTKDEMYLPAADGTPRPGDLIFFDHNNNDSADHVGIVTKVDEKKGIDTIEGNTSNKVAHRHYDWDDETVLGYGLLPENPEPYGMQLKAASQHYDVTVFFGKDAGIPADAKVRVTEYAEGSKEYQRAKDAVVDSKSAASADEKSMGFAALDVSLLDADGEEFEPAAPVRVAIAMRELPKNMTPDALQETMEVRHLVEENNALTVQETVNAASDETQGVIETDAETATATIQVDGLSPFTITWDESGWTWQATYATFDLQYKDTDGNVLEPGGTLDKHASSNETIDLTGSQYKKTIDGYTFDKIEFDGEEITKIKTVYSRGGWVQPDSYSVQFINGNTVVKEYPADSSNPPEFPIQFIYQKDNTTPGGGDTPGGGEGSGETVANLVVQYVDESGNTIQDSPAKIPLKEGESVDLTQYAKTIEGYTQKDILNYYSTSVDSVKMTAFRPGETNWYYANFFKDGQTTEKLLTPSGNDVVIRYVYQANSTPGGEADTVGKLIFHYVNDDGTKISDTLFTNLNEGDDIDLNYYAYEVNGYTFADQITNDSNETVDRAVVVKNEDGSFSLQLKANGENVGDSIPLPDGNSEVPITYHYTERITPVEENTEVQAKLTLHYLDERGRSFIDEIPVELKVGDSINLLNGEYYKSFDDHPFKSLTLAGQDVARVAVVQEEERIPFTLLYRTHTYVVFYDKDGNEILREETNPDNPKTYDAFYMYAGRMDEGGGGTTPHSGSGTRPLPEPDLSKLPDPTASKTLTPNLKDPNDPNSGDGTYTLTLRVQVPEQQAKNQNRANIVIAYDSSNSMTEATEYIPDPNGAYGTWNGKDFDPIDSFGRLYNRETGQTPYYYGDRYRPGPTTRMAEAKKMVKSLGNDLLALNDTFGEGTVEMAFVEYATTILHGSDDLNRITADPTVFDGWVDACKAPKEENDNYRGATNWELALQTANQINFDDDPTYIIFISDGNPTVRVSPPTGGDGDRIYNGAAMGVYGTGNSDTKNYNFNAANAVANNILNQGKVLFNVGIYGDATTMGNLSNNGIYDCKDVKDEDGNIVSGASDEMAAAFDDIIKSITKRVGYTDVVVTDGITSMTSSTLVHGDPKDFTYKVTIPDPENPGQTKDVTDQYLPAEQRNAKYVATENPNEAGKVTWDLGEELLLDGATYSVSFKVWPNQDAYDLVADLNNGLRKWSGLTDVEKAQVVGSGDGTQAPFSLRTNTDAGVTYKPVKAVTDSSGNSSLTKGDQKEIKLNPPDPMPLVDTAVKVQKQWDDSLDPTELADFLKANPGYKVDLDLMKGENEYISNIIIEPVANEKVWPDSEHPGGHHISDGLMVSAGAAEKSGLAVKDEEGNSYYPTTEFGGKTYYILEKGHDYKFKEDVLDYHFELEDKVFHPMVVDGVKMDVTFADGSNTIMKMEDFSATLTAVNSIKGGINIMKQIVDEHGNVLPATDKESVFVIHGSVTKGGQGVALEYRLIGDEYTDEDNKPGRSPKVTIDASSSPDFTVNIHAGDTIRIVNVPSGCDYEFYEVTSENGAYEFYSIEGSVTRDGSEVQTPVYNVDGTIRHGATEGASPVMIVSEDGKTLSGTSIVNAAQNVVVKNMSHPVDIKVIKTDMTGTKKLPDAKFGLYTELNEDQTAGNPGKRVGTVASTDENGIITFSDILPGTYYLVEEEAPEGYVISQGPIEVKVTNGGVTYMVNGNPGEVTTTTDSSTVTYGITVKNSNGYEMPHTGGVGTTWFTLSGAILITGALALYGCELRRKRKEER